MIGTRFRAVAVGVAAAAAVLSWSAAAIPADQAVAAAVSVERPNVVLILTDDMRKSQLSSMPRTKALIQARGATFTRAIHSYPLCCPARASLLTGQYVHNHLVWGNKPPSGGYQKFKETGANRHTIPVWLREAGYRTGFVGKYLNGYHGRSPSRDGTPGRASPT